MELPIQRRPGVLGTPILRRRMDRMLPCTERRTSKVWDHYTQLSMYRVECNHCKRQLSFHNSTTSMREHLGRKHSIRDGAVPPPNPANVHNPAALHQQMVQPNILNSRFATGCSDKRAGVFTDLILEMVFRDLQPLSVVEERGFRLLLSCLEPNYPVPSPSLLGSLLWHRYHILKQCLQRHLQTGLAPRCLALCTEHWRSVEGCGVDGSGQSYLTVSAHFVDSNWRLARCVLETRPIPEYKRNNGLAKFADILKAVLSEFNLPENYVFCALKLCVQEGLYVETVRQALADARGIVLHFQHDAKAAAALNQKAEAANKGAARLVLDDPSRWATAIDMCESLLELKWVVSSVLEEQKAAPNLADHQWRLLHELVPVLRTVRIAASFLSEDINAAISALMPCLQGVSRLLGQNMAECSCPVVRGVMERIRTGMEKRWRLSDEEALLESPAVLSSFLDPRFKEMRFLSPHARSKLHDKVKELLSVQAFNDDGTVDQEIDSGLEVGRGNEAEGGPAVLGLDDPLPIPTVASLDSPESCPSAEEGDSIELQQNENFAGVSSPEQVNENVLVGLSPLHWWRNKEHRFPAVARLARKYLAIPATGIPADRAFAPRESAIAHRRAMMGPKHLDHVLFLHQNCDYVEQLKGGSSGHRENDHNSNVSGNQSRESLYQTLVSYDNKV
uniref:Zinc finger BED-type containing 4-like 2 n=1 Tax=Astyanax mexicanus TaxID=7994 RepID=W5L2R2_ASTMX